MKLIDEILMDLVPFMDKVFLCPLTSKEIGELEKIYQRKFPEFYRYFLSRIGIRQDFVWGLLGRKFDFKNISEFISSTDYFQIGDNGGEDYWLLKFDEEDDKSVYDFDYYCNSEINKINTFDTILIDAFEDVKTNYDKRLYNSQKGWHVEFSTNTSSTKFLEKELGKTLDVKVIKEPLKVVGDSGKDHYEVGIIQINGEKVELKKWIDDRSLSFNWKEPVENMKSNSLTDKIDSALRECQFKHSMVQYGILPLKLD